jgi:Kef-type K+ transport system membrane component KefB
VHPHTELKLDAIGNGFVIPVFFVANGVRFDAPALSESGAGVQRAASGGPVRRRVAVLPGVVTVLVIASAT